MLHSLLESSHEAIAEVEGMFGGAGSFIGDNFQLTKIRICSISRGDRGTG